MHGSARIFSAEVGLIKGPKVNCADVPQDDPLAAARRIRRARVAATLHEGDERETGMATGDAGRVWFAEMLQELASTWSPSMTWEELADFCQRMTGTRRALRAERGILPPMTRCRRCGKVSRSDIQGVSIRSALFALKRMDRLGEEDFKALDKRWKRHKERHGLDPFGRQAGAGSEEEHEGCG